MLTKSQVNNNDNNGSDRPKKKIDTVIFLLYFSAVSPY